MNKFFACLLSSVVLLVSISCNISAEEATNEIDEPRMGLIWDENELNSDMFETSPESEISAYASLPKSVDLSKSPCFPPIGNQKSLGACGPFATTYYQFSYEVNKLNNVTSASQRCVYSPKWTYNLVNKGEDKGTSIGKCYEVLKNLGSLKNADFPYTGDKDDYLDFPSMQKQEKVDALKTRVSNLYTIDISSNKQISSPNSAELNTVKTVLNNGKVLTAYSKFCWDSYYDTKTKECIAYRCKNDLNGGAHLFAIVGYDDNKSYDVNKNGIIEECEKGAFKIANSWGTSFNAYGVKSETGYMWVMYDALNSVSTNTYNKWESSCTGERVPAFAPISQNLFFYIDVKHFDINYTGELWVGLKNRNTFAFKIGKSKLSDYDCSNEEYYLPFEMMYSPTDESNQFSGFLYFDYGSLAQSIPDSISGYNWYVYLENMSGAYDSVRFRVVDDLAKGITGYATVYATKGDRAQLYRNISLKRGDVDYSGSLDSKDVDLISTYVAKRGGFSNIQMYLGDVNEDGVVNILDAAALNRLIS